jgi:hypothetical protein
MLSSAPSADAMILDAGRYSPRNGSATTWYLSS